MKGNLTFVIQYQHEFRDAATQIFVLDNILTVFKMHEQQNRLRLGRTFRIRLIK